MGLPYQDLI
jgi:hypothetical protein